MTRARTSVLPPPAAHSPDVWLKLSEAATYVRRTESGLRSVIHRGELKPDGAGPRRTHTCFARRRWTRFWWDVLGAIPVIATRRPGTWSLALAERPTGKQTRYPGVTRLPDGRFLLRAKVENPKTGRMQERERIVECATAAEAARLRDELRDPVGVADARRRVRLSDFSISWLSGKRKEIKAATLDRYTRTLAHHIVPQLGDYYVDALTHNDIVEWRNSQDSQASARSEEVDGGRDHHLRPAS